MTTLMKTIYTQPACEIIVLHTELVMQTTSRYSNVGKESPTNSSSTHYNDPTGGIQSISGGSSLSKSNSSWENVGEWD